MLFVSNDVELITLVIKISEIVEQEETIEQE